MSEPVELGRRRASAGSSRPMRLALFVLLACGPWPSLQANPDDAASRYRADQQKADEIYARGQHAAALERYLKLAKKGDMFSQYRVSYMYFAGEGTEQDWPEAYAWALLAAQTGIPQFVAYRDQIAANVPGKKRRAALRRADYYYRRWGNLALLGELQRSARKELRDCTGSRLGTRCEDVYAVQMPTSWGINPGPGTGGAGAPRDAQSGGTSSPSGTHLAGASGAGGGSGRDVEYYQNLRQSIAQLDQYIRSQTGTVELGELEVVEPEQAPASGETDGPR